MPRRKKYTPPAKFAGDPIQDEYDNAMLQVVIDRLNELGLSRRWLYDHVEFETMTPHTVKRFLYAIHDMRSQNYAEVLAAVGLKIVPDPDWQPPMESDG